MDNTHIRFITSGVTYPVGFNQFGGGMLLENIYPFTYMAVSLGANNFFLLSTAGLLPPTQQHSFVIEPLHQLNSSFTFWRTHQTNTTLKSNHHTCQRHILFVPVFFLFFCFFLHRLVPGNSPEVSATSWRRSVECLSIHQNHLPMSFHWKIYPGNRNQVPMRRRWTGQHFQSDESRTWWQDHWWVTSSLILSTMVVVAVIGGAIVWRCNLLGETALLLSRTCTYFAASW